MIINLESHLLKCKVATYLSVSIYYFLSCLNHHSSNTVMFIGRVPKIISTSESLKCLSITLLIQRSMLPQNLVPFWHSIKARTNSSPLLQNTSLDKSTRFIPKRILLVINPWHISLKVTSVENVLNVTRNKLIRKMI